MEPIILYTAQICPFAHRSRLAITAKDLPHERVEIDLADKPDWYREINPDGAVPALRQGDFLLRESLVINEYLDDLADHPPLLPATPRERAAARLWIELFSSSCVPGFYRLLRAQDAEQRAAAADRLHQALATVNAELEKHATGPYWWGADLSLTDIACYPWFERWAVLEHYRDFALPKECGALHDWLAAMAEHPAVGAEMHPVAFYIEAYQDYARGTR